MSVPTEATPEVAAEAPAPAEVNRTPELHAPPLSTIPETVPFEESEWIDDFMASPTQPMTTSPDGLTELEARLDPEACGSCHPTQYLDWKESLHAHAMGPGMMGQLLDSDGPEDRFAESCQRCHAPLGEQLPFLDGAENAAFDPEMRLAGLTCATCHVRDHQRFGPPSGRPPIPEAPHEGFVSREEYSSSRFCYNCHDFQEGMRELEGKLIQETHEEWRRTSYAAEGITCQDCHMPEGRHLFKGIHDLEMTRSAFTASVEGPSIDESGVISLRATIENSGAGHRFPTYVTPSLVLRAEQVGSGGEGLEGGGQLLRIGRETSVGIRTEAYDTRLLPGESITLEYAAPLLEGAEAVLVNLTVEPDAGYTRFYEAKLRQSRDSLPLGAPLLEEALRASRESHFTAWEQRVPVR